MSVSKKWKSSSHPTFQFTLTLSPHCSYKLWRIRFFFFWKLIEYTFLPILFSLKYWCCQWIWCINADSVDSILLPTFHNSFSEFTNAINCREARDCSQMEQAEIRKIANLNEKIEAIRSALIQIVWKSSFDCSIVVLSKA